MGGGGGGGTPIPGLAYDCCHPPGIPNTVPVEYCEGCGPGGGGGRGADRGGGGGIKDWLP